MNRPELPSSSSETLTLDLEMNVNQRLDDLRIWATDWEAEDDRLRQRIESLNPNFRADVLLGSQISSIRRHLACRIVRQPIFLDPAHVRSVGLAVLRQHLASQYACLSQKDRQMWLTNLFFLLTPTLQALIEKLDTIRQYRSLGQARCLLLGGVSGTGKMMT